jgi:hypothetical protein
VDGAEKRNAVQRMKDYIKEHITEPITLRILADASWLGASDAPQAEKKSHTPLDPPVTGGSIVDLQAYRLLRREAYRCTRLETSHGCVRCQ